MLLTDRQQYLDSPYEHDAEVQPPRSRQRRDQILNAANALFAERTYDEVSIEDIASSAHVTRGLVHHYFGGRKEVYIALLERLGAVREEQLPPPVGRSAAPAEMPAMARSETEGAAQGDHRRERSDNPDALEKGSHPGDSLKHLL